MEQRVVELLDRHWKSLLALFYLLLCAWLIYSRWANIQGFVLADTDDNMRISQVRAWLNDGQGWYDLRQYKLNWPDGANIHWSRLVDLPLAGLILLGRVFRAGPQAELFAVGVAPLIPLAVLATALALTVRRLVHPSAWPLALICLFFAGSTMAQFVPTRIDHHGWQLALLAISVAGIADPRRARGGATLGIASAMSLAIGLEAMIYIALAGVGTVLRWVADRAQSLVVQLAPQFLRQRQKRGGRAAEQIGIGGVGLPSQRLGHAGGDAVGHRVAQMIVEIEHHHIMGADEVALFQEQRVTLHAGEIIAGRPESRIVSEDQIGLCVGRLAKPLQCGLGHHRDAGHRLGRIAGRDMVHRLGAPLRAALGDHALDQLQGGEIAHGSTLVLISNTGFFRFQ